MRRTPLFVAGLLALGAPLAAPVAMAQTTDATTPAFHFNVRVYADFTDKENKDKGADTKSADSGVGVDVKRFYFTAISDFDKVWSATFQSDIGDQGAKRYDVFVKKAFIQAKIAPEAMFRLGSADTAWIPYVEGVYGYRYVEQTLTDHLSFGNSADWGLHFLGKAGVVSYQLSAENGRGYSNPTRSKNVDFEGRVSAEPVPGLQLALGGYSGKRGLDTNAVVQNTFHTATRTDALVGYVSKRFRIGGEWFEADNWNRVNVNGPEDKSDGTSVWASAGLTDMLNLFGRYDQAKPSKDLNPNLKFTYYNAGLELRANKAFAASLVYKFAQVEGGTLSTGNGTIGSTKLNLNNKGEYNEIGIFAVYDFTY